MLTRFFFIQCVWGISCLHAADVARIGTNSYSSLESAIAAAQSGDTITLIADTALSAPLVIQKNLTLVSDGTSRRITADPSSGNFANNAWMLLNGEVGVTLGSPNAPDSPMLILDGGSTSFPASYVLDNLSATVISIGSTSQLTIHPDVSIQNHFGLYGPVWNNGQCTLAGGNIVNNCALYVGGGVVNQGTFSMLSGRISNNMACHDGNSFYPDIWGGCGGGVYNTGNFIMHGGTIASNQATFTNASIGIYFYGGRQNGHGGAVFNLGSFDMRGGDMCNNQSFGDTLWMGGQGGGVYNKAYAYFSGGRIQQNRAIQNREALSDYSILASGGALLNEGTSYISGTTFFKNHADFYGGAVENFYALEISGGIFQQNNAQEDAPGIDAAEGLLYLRGNPEFIGDNITVVSSESPISLSGVFTLPGIIATISPMEYTEGFQVLSNAAAFPAVSNYYAKFAISEEGWYINNQGRLTQTKPSPPPTPPAENREIIFTGKTPFDEDGHVQLQMDEVVLQYNFQVESADELLDSREWNFALDPDVTLITTNGLVRIAPPTNAAFKLYRLKF